MNLLNWKQIIEEKIILTTYSLFEDHIAIVSQTKDEADRLEAISQITTHCNIQSSA